MAKVAADPIEILMEMGFDLDDISSEEGYLSALKEAITTIQFKTKGAGDDRILTLLEEVKKVRAGRTGRTRKPSVDAAKSFISPKALPGSVGVRGGALTVGQTLLSSSAKNKQQQQVQKKSVFDVIANSLNAVANSLNNVAKSITELLGVERQTAERQRQGAVTAKRQDEEKDRLKGAKDLIGGLTSPVINTVKKPAMGILDRIKTFLGNVAAGSVVGWLTDEGNKDKVLGVFNFLEEHMGKIMTGIIALLGIGIGIKLAGLITTLISLTTTLLGLVVSLATNPVVLAGLGIIAGTKAIADVGQKVELAGQELIGGKGTTAAGNQFSFSDIQDLREERKTFMTMSGMSSEAIQQQSKPFDDLMDAMKEQKRINDDLYNKKQAQASGDIRFDKVIPELEKKKAEQQKKVTELFQKLGITDQDLKQLQMREGRVEKDDTHFEKPGTGLSGALSNLGANLQEATYGSGMTQAQVDAEILKSTQPGGMFEGYDVSQLEFDHELGIPSVKPPSFDIKSTAQKDATYSKITGDIKRTQLQTQKLQEMNLSAVDYFGGGSTVSQMEELKAAMANGGMTAGASADQQEAPSFSAVDMTNDNIFMTSGVYNSPS